MKYVAKAELSGFRRPVRAEAEKMASIVSRRLKMERRVMKIWLAICAFLEAAVLAALTGWRGLAFGETMVMVILAFVMSISLICIYRGLARNQKLLVGLQAGAFEVLDCHAYEAVSSTDTVGSGIIRIYTEQGQYCRDNFLVDLTSVREWPDHRDMKFWLLKCTCGNGNGKPYYQMFSERMIDR